MRPTRPLWSTRWLKRACSTKKPPKAADTAVLNALAEKAKPGKVTKLNGATSNNPDDEVGGLRPERWDH